jgi:Fe-S oxidoreductase
MMYLLPILAEPRHFALWERGLFVALATASVYGFFRRFGPILGKILRSKKDPDFHLFPIAKRVRDFVWEVLLQAKVIRERPLVGFAHALVFWAFCAFALVTLNHCAVIFGLGFLDPTGRIGRLYFDFAAVFAIACAIGIFGLFVRRFFVRPKWLDELSWQSGLIALLIFVLMATYLAAFFVTRPAGAVQALWWAHTVTLLAFFPLIPHTKHLHLVLSPFTVFFSRGSFAHIPPLSGDEDFGLVAGRDLTRLVSLQAYSCVECGRCMEHCPANATGKQLNPKEIVLGLRGYLNEFGPRSEEPLLGKYESQEAAFECTTCGACEFQCPVGIEHVPILVGLRRGAVNTGAWEDDHGSKLFLALERGSNALGMASGERDKFVEKHALPIFDGTQEYCLWLGCMGAYDPQGREIVLALVRVMQHLGASFGVLRKEKCTGDPVRRLGNDLLFQQLAEANLEALRQNRVKKIVTICPHCVRTIQEDWKEFGAPPDVEHHSEFLARHLDELRLVSGHDFRGSGITDWKRHDVSGSEESPSASGLVSGHDRETHPAGESLVDSARSLVSGRDFSRAEGNGKNDGALAPEQSRNEKIVFHDPCYLGRYRNVYDEPRQIAALAGELVEAPRSRERSFCCGAGGGLAFLGEEKGDRVSHARAAELAATGASVVAAACPFCNTMFRDALAARGEGAPELMDIAQIAAKTLDRGEPSS